MDAATVIFDNGGGITLQIGAWAHHYTDPRSAAIDLEIFFDEGSADGWDGHEAESAACNPTDDEIRNGGYQVAVYSSWGEAVNDKRNNGWVNVRDFRAAIAKAAGRT